MDDQNKLTYRLDPMKLQQKIYELYPANSVVRKRMLDDLRQDQLSYYTKILNDYPVQVAEISLVENKQLMIRYAITGAVLFVFGLFGLASGFLFNLTTLESILSSILGGLAMGTGLAQFKLVFSLKQASSQFVNAVEGVKKKIEELRKDL